MYIKLPLGKKGNKCRDQVREDIPCSGYRYEERLWNEKKGQGFVIRQLTQAG